MDAATGQALPHRTPGPLARLVARLTFHGPALVLLLLVAAAPFLTCVVRGETPFFLDLADHWYPFRVHAWEARQAGEIAHWCRHAFCGFPFLPQPEAALAYPPHWVLDLFHPSKTLLAQVIGHRFVLGALLYAVLVARGASRTAAFLGGALLVASGVTMSCFSQLAVLRTFAWIPLVLLGAWRLAQRRRLEGMLWTALGVALALVAGYPPFLQRAAIVLPLLYLADPTWQRNAADWIDRAARVGWAAAAAALGAAMAAAQLIPTLVFTGGSQRRLGLDPALLDSLRAEPLDLLMLLAPRTDVDSGVGKQGFAYVGVLAVALAAFAVVRRRPGAAAFAAAAGLALVASMGRAMPVVGDLLASLPLVGSFRNPGQYLVAWVLIVPVLAAMGLDAWRERRPTAREAACVLGGVGALLFVATLVPSPMTDPASLIRAAIGLAGLGVGALALFAPPRAAVALLVAAALGDAATFQFNYPTKLDREKRPRSRPVASLLVPDEPFAIVAKRHRDTGREGAPRVITSDAGFNWENHGWMLGVDSVRGLAALVPMRALDLNRIVELGAPFPSVPPSEPLYAYGPVHALDSPRIDLLAVRYAIGFPARPGPEWRPVPGGERGGIWERDAVPEARLVERVLRARYDGEALELLTAPAFDVRCDVVAVDPDSAYLVDGGDAQGSVRIVEVSSNRVVMEVDARRRGTLVWAETFDEGWSAHSEDAALERDWVVSRVNWSQMATVVEEGKTRLVWTYETPGWATGMRVSVAAAAVFLLLAAVASARRLGGA